MKLGNVEKNALFNSTFAEVKSDFVSYLKILYCFFVFSFSFYSIHDFYVTVCDWHTE